MEWLAANIVNLIVAGIMICGGIAFSFNLDTRLKNIEKEQTETKLLVVISARLEERLTSLYQIVINQGKRLDRVVERVYGQRHEENECSD